MYFTVNIFASLRFYKWYLFNELSGSTSRRPSISIRLPLRPVLLFWHPFPSFQSFLFVIKLRLITPVSFGTAKVGNFLKPANFFFIFLFFYFRTRNIYKSVSIISIQLHFFFLFYFLRYLRSGSAKVGNIYRPATPKALFILKKHTKHCKTAKKNNKAFQNQFKTVRNGAHVMPRTVDLYIQPIYKQGMEHGLYYYERLYHRDNRQPHENLGLAHSQQT